MAKNKKTQKPVNKAVEEEKIRLPQNIVPIGERVEEDKNIYISQSVYKEIHKFTTDKTVNEAGGILVGDVIEEFGKTNIIINGFVEAKHCEATPTTLTFTHETWDQCHKDIDKKFSKKRIVGWIHTHPNYGIFLSEYDKFIQENFFSDEFDVAYVIDPIQDIEGFYFWINGKIEKCKGFYIFDSTGKKIDIQKEQNEEKSTKTNAVQSNSKTNTIIGILCAVVFALIIAVFSLNSKINSLQDDYDKLNSEFQSVQMDVHSICNERQSTQPTENSTTSVMPATPSDSVQ